MARITNFQTIIEQVQAHGRQTVVVAAAQEQDVLTATLHAQREGMARLLYVGDTDEIRQIAKHADLDLSGIEMLHEPDPLAAGRKALDLIKDGTAQVLMKGKIGTGDILGLVLKDEDLKKRQDAAFVSHTTIFAWDGQLKLFADAALNIAPDLAQKRKIALNALHTARALGIDVPRVAFLSAVEKVNPKMASSVDAAALAQMPWDQAIVGGPLAFDGALFEKAYHLKGVPSPVAGQADILICPNIETGNVLYKTLAWMLQCDLAGVITGAAIPCILTSRADSARVKFLSIAATLFFAQAC